MQKINIINLQREVPINKRKIISQATRALKIIKLSGSLDLAIVFVNNRQIKKINYKYRGKNKPTDILAFCLYRSKKLLVADLVISVQKARENARVFDNALEREIALYIIHGILHLGGHSDKNKRLRGLMDKKQFFVLDKICQG